MFVQNHSASLHRWVMTLKLVSSDWSVLSEVPRPSLFSRQNLNFPYVEKNVEH